MSDSLGDFALACLVFGFVAGDDLLVVVFVASLERLDADCDLSWASRFEG